MGMITSSREGLFISNFFFLSSSVRSVTYMSPQWRAKAQVAKGGWKMDGWRRRWGLRCRVDGFSMSQPHLMGVRRKPLPAAAHGTWRYEAAARRAHVARDVEG